MTDYKNVKVKDDTAKTLIKNVIDGLLTGAGCVAFITVFFMAQSSVWG